MLCKSLEAESTEKEKEKKSNQMSVKVTVCLISTKRQLCEPFNSLPRNVKRG